jgi:hypothetical protein
MKDLLILFVVLQTVLPNYNKIHDTQTVRTQKDLLNSITTHIRIN